MSKPKVFLNTYIFKIREKGTSDQFIDLPLIEGKDFHDFFYDFLVDLKNTPFKRKALIDPAKADIAINQDHNRSQVLKIDATDVPHKTEGRVIYVMLKDGISGDSHDIDDVNTGQTVFSMKKHHSRMVPSYCQIRIPASGKYGYLILQKQGTHGVKLMLKQALKAYMEKYDLNDKYVFDIRNFISQAVFTEMIEQGVIPEISYTKNIIPREMEDFLDEGHKKINGTVRAKTTVTNPVGLQIKEFAKKIFTSYNNDNMVELDELAEEYMEVDFKIKYAGKIKKFNMKNKGRTVPSHDVSDDVRYVNSEVVRDGKTITEEIIDIKCLLKIGNELMSDMDKIHLPKIVAHV
ncbi:MAG: hypothetical protein NT150_00980 [Bacteroidetes bacterium]|nr:hypothetical protein [Bacteroidota bacterium]